VLNTCEGFHHVGLHERSTGEVINLGSNREISIKDLAQLIATLMNKELKIEIDDQRIRPEKSEVERLLCDSSKAKELTGWEPRHTLEEGLNETIGWLEDHMEYYKPDIYNV
jgi:dTDP-glucose 4,6-dehydratase